jgi:hypothetical protein
MLNSFSKNMHCPANIRMIMTTICHKACGKTFLHMTGLINFSFLLILYKVGMFSSNLSTNGSVQMAAAAKMSMTRFIHNNWITLNGGFPMEQAEINTMTNKLIFMVSWN